MAKPSIISSKKPHTVSLSEGSNVATRKAPPKKIAEPDLPLPVPTRAASKSAPAKAPRAARPAPSVAALPPQPQPVMAPPPAPEPLRLGQGVHARIAELKRRNDAVRATLPAGARAVAKST